MSDSLEAEVQGSFHAYASLWNARAELLNSVSRLLASMSDVRAAFGTRDQATIRDTASELWSRISTSAGLFLVTDPRGKVIASLGGVDGALAAQGSRPGAVRGGALPAAIVGLLPRGAASCITSR